MVETIPLTVLRKGFFKLSLMLLPFSLLMLAYLFIMGGSAPASDALQTFAVVFAFIFLMPAALVFGHVAGAKLFDGVLRLVPFAKAEISWLGVLFSAVLVVVAGNVLVDDLYQVSRGDYGLSVIALGLDVSGMVAVVLSGGGRMPTPRKMFPHRE
ncbi:MAG: hypothetical protein HQL33_01740 [Alphaproteobacteria bacterium]|nr:hypothetical protein [Alphaproteobacteria bacterium]MBF0128692.1 hypothetical protein [Alphaproteobacteria bacterium]